MHSNINPDVVQNKTFQPTDLFKSGVRSNSEIFQSHNLPSPHKDVCVSAVFIDQWGQHRRLIFMLSSCLTWGMLAYELRQ